MTRRIVPPDEYPWWVQLSQWGVPFGRAGLWFFVALALACAVASAVYAGMTGRWPWLAVSAVSVACALPYWLSIRWIDRYGSWAGRDRVRDEYGD